MSTLVKSDLGNITISIIASTLVLRFVPPNSPWIEAGVGAFATLVVAEVFDRIRQRPLNRTLELILIGTGAATGFFHDSLSPYVDTGLGWLSTEITAPLWVFLAPVLITVVVIESMRRIPSLWGRRPSHDYTSDTFLQIRWRWSWKGDQPADLVPYCPTCPAELIETQDGSHSAPVKAFPSVLLVCPECGRRFEVRHHDCREDINEAVVGMIQRNVVSGKRRMETS